MLSLFRSTCLRFLIASLTLQAVVALLMEVVQADGLSQCRQAGRQVDPAAVDMVDGQVRI